MTNRIERMKRNTGLSEYEIAKRSGLAKQTINNQKHRNSKDMSVSTARKLAKGLDMPLEKFLEEYGD